MLFFDQMINIVFAHGYVCSFRGGLYPECTNSLTLLPLVWKTSNEYLTFPYT